jgi:putative transposase
METADHFIGNGQGSKKLILMACGLSRSSYYYKPKRGTKVVHLSDTTLTEDGEILTNAEVLRMIRDLLGQEFVNYGYVKVTHYLKQQGLMINKKKVYRLMKQANLLRPKPKKNVAGKCFVKYRKVRASRPFEYLALDIKYIWVPSMYRNVYLLSVMDIYSRSILGYRLAGRIRHRDVEMLLKQIFVDLPAIKGMIIRNDNGSQFVAHEFRAFLAQNGIVQEFTHIATPEENGHIEAFHKILQDDLLERFEYHCFAELSALIERYIDFYNLERLHKGVD